MDTQNNPMGAGERIPRSKERGPVEARIGLFIPVKSILIPRSKERGPVEAIQMEILKVALTHEFRARKSAAPLKPIVRQPSAGRAHDNSALERARPR